MRKTVIAFPLDRQAKSLARFNTIHSDRPLVGRWSVNPDTGRLEQHWFAEEPSADVAATGTDGIHSQG